jgi:IS30 family transposase
MRPISEKQRLLAESLFVAEGKSARQIAAVLGLGKSTVQRCVLRGKWVERRRRRGLDSPLATLERLKRERDRQAATLGGDTAPAQATLNETISAVHKLTQTIEKMESRHEDEDVGAMLAAMDRFAKFAAAHATDEQCAAVRALMEKFFDDERRKSL